jgi:uncharacterized radical SAM superfamily protein
MSETERIVVWVILGILLLSMIIAGGSYYYKQLEVENFQNTIKDLSDEQKCIHICGFQFEGYFENYKMCIEKCDRISERENTNCEGLK